MVALAVVSVPDVAWLDHALDFQLPPSASAIALTITSSAASFEYVRIVVFLPTVW